MALAWVTTENGIFNSALHRGLPDGQRRLWVNNGLDGHETRLPVHPEQRTSVDRPDWSVSCQKETRQPLQRSITPSSPPVSAGVEPDSQTRVPDSVDDNRR
jgi:hypothetical protein